ncbi:hypothetical protein D0Y65_022582 [Glycine soja]|uniref:Uncharacterized protein n=1 Tax=Glycine soja TaxID=3848 RepID=A0A445JP87_GLYSO|nr:hypothetical protein D0Y65_022582 [Glycine soja]
MPNPRNKQKLPQDASSDVFLGPQSQSTVHDDTENIVMHFPHLTTAPRTMGFVYTTTMVLKDVKSSFSNVDHAKRGNGAASTKQNTTYHCQKHTINNKSNIINKATQCLVVLFN